MRIRWIDTSCFEIVTNEGEVIVTDPYIDECENHPVSSDDVQRMDYILVTHTHFDHIAQLDKYFEEYRPQILTTTIAGNLLLKELDLSGQCLYSLVDGEQLDFGKTRFTLSSGKHAVPNRTSRHLVRESAVVDAMGFDFRTDAYRNVMYEGYHDFANWYIETADNTRILFWGGATTHEQVKKAGRFHPDIILMQIPSNSHEGIAELVRESGASFVVPHHHDVYYKTRDVEAMMVDLKQVIERTCPWTTFVSTVPGRWYEFSKTLLPAS